MKLYTHMQAFLEQHSTYQIQRLELTIVTTFFFWSLFRQAYAPALAKVMTAS